MKKILLFVLSLCLSNSFGQNLLINGSAEIVENSEILNWIPTVGGVWLVSEYTVYPQVETETAGTQFFYPGYNYANVDGELTSELSQVVDISTDSTAIDSGAMNYYFDGYVISFDQAPADQSNVHIDFFDDTDFLLSTTHFGPFSNVQAWNHLTETVTAPANARKAKVRLRSVLINGSSCDGLYEDLYFGRSSLQTHDLSRKTFTVFPNPAKSVVNIASESTIDSILISDLTGKVVLSKTSDANQIDISKLSNGVYLLTVNSFEKRLQQKIIKN